MAVHKLIPYWIEVRESGETNVNWDQTAIHNHDPNFPEDNLADYFYSFIEDYKDDVHVDEEGKKTFTVAEPVKRNENTIEGRFKSGEWGRNADFWDIEEHERIEDAREENHAEEIPYYFLFHIPDVDRSQALLILSKYKRKGIKTTFRDLFLPRQKGVGTSKAYTTIRPHYSDKILEEIEEADEIASVKFRGKDQIPARDKYAEQKNIEKIGDEISGQIEVGTELKMAPRGNEDSFREFVKGLTSKGDKSNFDYGRIENNQFSSASVTVVEGESQLTFSLWKERIQMRMDVDPEEYDLDIYGGHPTPHSIGSVARQLANDLMGKHNTSLSTESLIPKTIGVPEEDEGDEEEPLPQQD